MKKEELEDILTRHRDWLAGKEGGSRAYLSRAYLSGADLSGANLSGANLSGAYLSGAYLSGADLSGYAQVAFKGHGECGRMLTVIRQNEDSAPYFCCGCFRGSEQDLRDYIERGQEHLKPSRLFALETALTLLNHQP